MRIIPGSIPTRDNLIKEYFSIYSASENAHSDIAQTFSEINKLYNQSSILEDVTLNEYLSLINMTKSIKSKGFINRGFIVESYTSSDYIDNSFPVDEQLNLDAQNGDLTLPIDTTNTLKVSDIIVENGSNGSFGNSLKDFENEDIKSIINGGDGNIFEYEKITNRYNSTVLKLGITLKIERDSIANGVYVRTHIVEDLNYPKIESAQTSLDGVTWSDAINILNINKSDHYIRFMPNKIRFVRLLFSQNDFYNVTTLFGKKRRYMIGIREVSIKQTIYKQSGEYVSINFSGRGPINRIAFDASQIDNNDIKYYISANNGSKWLEIKPGFVSALNDLDLGMHGEIGVRNIRVKVKMDRGFSPITTLATQNIQANTSDKYVVKRKPVSATAYIGKYISYGNETQYTVNINASNDVDPSILKDHGCPTESTVHMNTLYWVPFRNTLLNELDVRINGKLLKNDGSIYIFIPHENPNHCNIVFISDYTQSGILTLSYKPYVHDHRHRLGNLITLPMPSIINNNTGFTIRGIVYSDNIPVPQFPTANSQVTDHEVTKLFDGDHISFWRSDERTVEGCWEVTWDNSETKQIKMYSLSPASVPPPIEDETLSKFRYNPTRWELLGSNDSTNWKVLDSRSTSITFWNSGEFADFPLEYPCSFLYYKLRIYNNAENNDPEQQSDTCCLQSIRMYTVTDQQLKPEEDFVVIDRSTIKIIENKYNPKWDYIITYYPAINISGNIKELDGNSITLSGITNLMHGSEISFDYLHEDTTILSDIKYYTPISKEYRLELL